MKRFRLRNGLIVAIACLLAACQQTGGGANPPPDAAHVGHDANVSYFRPEVDALLNQLGAKLAQVCAGKATSEDSLDTCIRDQFAFAFDDSGLGRKNCAFHAALADFLDCVTVGNTFIDVRHRLSDDSPVPAGYWSGQNAMADALAATVVRRGIDVCDTAGGLEHMTGCVEKWFEERLALPAPMIARCNASASGDERQTCIGEAFMLRYLQEHAPRLGAVSA